MDQSEEKEKAENTEKTEPRENDSPEKEVFIK